MPWWVSGSFTDLQRPLSLITRREPEARLAPKIPPHRLGRGSCRGCAFHRPRPSSAVVALFEVERRPAVRALGFEIGAVGREELDDGIETQLMTAT
jgi:hypothetical protein